MKRGLLILTVKRHHDPFRAKRAKNTFAKFSFSVFFRMTLFIHFHNHITQTGHESVTGLVQKKKGDHSHIQFRIAN